MSDPDFIPVFTDCWCKETHNNPFTDFGHGFLTTLRIPELVEWLAQKINPPRDES